MIYLTNRDGGITDEAGHYQFLAAGFNGNVLKGLTLVQTNPLGMKLNLTAGNARIPYGGYAYSAFVQEGETEEVQIGTANPSNPRIDRVVMYIDRAMARQTVNPNNPGIAKIAVVAGTPAGTPTRPSDANVNTAVSNNPWIDLADVRVNTGVTQITTANVTDKRVMASAVLGPNAVTADKIDFATYPRFSVYNNTSQTVGHSSTAVVNFQSVEFDIGSNFASNVFTAPVTGYYQFNANVSFRRVSGTVYDAYIILYKNNSEEIANNFGTYSSGSGVSLAVSKLVYLAQGNTIRLRLFAYGGGGATISAGLKYTFMTGYLVSL